MNGQTIYSCELCSIHSISTLHYRGRNKTLEYKREVPVVLCLVVTLLHDTVVTLLHDKHGSHCQYIHRIVPTPIGRIVRKVGMVHSGAKRRRQQSSWRQRVTTICSFGTCPTDTRGR